MITISIFRVSIITDLTSELTVTINKSKNYEKIITKCSTKKLFILTKKGFKCDKYTW